MARALAWKISSLAAGPLAFPLIATSLKARRQYLSSPRTGSSNRPHHQP